jgi:hypothetical protein
LSILSGFGSGDGQSTIALMLVGPGTDANARRRMSSDGCKEFYRQNAAKASIQLFSLPRDCAKLLINGLFGQIKVT